MLNFFIEKPYVNVYIRMLFICFLIFGIVFVIFFLIFKKSSKHFFNLFFEEPLDVVKTYPKNCEFLFIRETLNFFFSKTRNSFLSVALHKTCFKNCGFC